MPGKRIYKDLLVHISPSTSQCKMPSRDKIEEGIGCFGGPDNTETSCNW